MAQRFKRINKPSQRQRKAQERESKGNGMHKGTLATTTKYDIRGVMVVEGEDIKSKEDSISSTPVSESRGTGGAAPLKMPARAKLSRGQTQESLADVPGGVSQAGRWAT